MNSGSVICPLQWVADLAVPAAVFCVCIQVKIDCGQPQKMIQGFPAFCGTIATMNQSTAVGFPSHWPSECPPADSTACTGEYFHLLTANPPGKDDLKSFAEKERILRHVPRCPCMPYGLSVFAEREDAMFMQRAMPKLGAFIAVLQLRPDDGKAMRTPGQRPSHHTWWPSRDCIRVDKVESIEIVAPGVS